MTSGEILRELRGARSIAYIADKIGIDRSTLNLYELDQRTPSDSIKVKLANLYGHTVQEIFFDKRLQVASRTEC